MTQITTRKRPFLSATALATSLAITSLTGCQTMNGNAVDGGSATPVSSSALAKQQLQSTLERQMMSSFTYNSSIVLSNAQRMASLNNATPEQLNSVGNKVDYCEEVHDKAYIALLKHAEKTDTSIDDAVYDTQRQSLKNNYLNCDADYQQWDKESYKDNALKYLPNYDENHTLADKKKESMLDRHIIQPLTMNVTGSYQPLQGLVSILPAVNFDHRNLYVNVGQPIYLDIKKGDLYLWAETFAPLISEYIDDEIGASWKDSWFKLTLHDGSLPKDIEKSLIKAILEAKKSAYQQEPVAGFALVKPADVSTQLPFLLDSHASVITNTKQIISRKHSDRVNKHQSYLVQRKFYELLTAYEPELFVADTAESDQKNDGAEIFTSKKMLNMLLNGLKASISSYESSNHDYSAQQQDADSDQEMVAGTSEYFGLNGNKLAWWHVRKYNNFDKQSLKSETMHLDALTTFKATLPLATIKLNGVSTPNTDNSIDLLAYTNNLLTRNETESTSDFITMMKGFFMPSSNTDDSTDTQEADSAAMDNEALDEDALDNSKHSQANSAECVLLSVTIDTMCEPDFLENTDDKILKNCHKEKVEAETIYSEYCQ